MMTLRRKEPWLYATAVTARKITDTEREERDHKVTRLREARLAKESAEHTETKDDGLSGLD